MSVQSTKGRFPHVHWIDLNDDNTLVECVVLKKDQHNNIYFIQLDKLDGVDKQRIIKILHGRGVDQLELWDTMSSITLGNGLNALKYFHQLVKVITDAGTVMTPQLGRQGVVLVNTDAKAPSIDDVTKAQEIIDAGKEANVVPKKRGRKPNKKTA